MYSFDPQEWKQHYRRAAGPASKHVDRLLDRFQESLRDWLHAALNWPEEDWRTDLARFLDHSRGAGVIVEPDGRAALESLLRSRASGKGLLADRAQGRISKPPFQLVAVEFSNDGQDTDATVDYRAEPTEPELSYELAGSGPETSEAYQRKVKQILAVLDEFVARIWEQKRGIVRSRERNWLQFRYYSEKDDGRLVIVVSPEFTARDTALAILAEAYASGSNRINAEVLEKKLLTAEEIEKQYAELQTKAFKEAAGQAAFLAEFYVSSLASLTPAGELIVTVDDIDRNGFSWQHLFNALPLLRHLPFTVIAVSLKLKDGHKLTIPAPLLRKIKALGKAGAAKISKAVNLSKSPEEALEKIKKVLEKKKGRTSPKKVKPKTKPSKPAKKPPVSIKKGPGRWIKPDTNMRPRNRRYQTQISGRLEEYLVEGVKFDGYKNGTLLEAKGPGYVNFVTKNDEFYGWFRKKDELIDQATRQLEVANGIRIEWHIAEKKLYDAIEALFKDEGISGIILILTIPK